MAINLTPEEYKRLFELPPARAIEYLRSKGIIVSKTSKDLSAEIHRIAFTIAGVMSAELLETFKQYVLRAIEQGLTQEEFKKEFRPAMEAAGWIPSKTEKGVASRLANIYRTNLQSAYNKGRFDQMKANGATLIEFLVIADEVTTKICNQLKGKVVRIDDPNLRIPPFHYNCRTRIRSIPPRVAQRRNIQPETMQQAQGNESVMEGFNRKPDAEFAPDYTKYDPQTAEALSKLLATNEIE